MNDSTLPAAVSTRESAERGHSGFRDFLFRWRGWGVIALGAAFFAVALWWRWRTAEQATGQSTWIALAPPLRDPLLALPLVAFGLFFRIWARCYFTRGSDTRRIQAHRLILRGPYRRVRNPLYVGNMAVAGGLALAFVGPLAAAAFLVALGLLYSGVIRSEEAVLLKTWGESYADFTRRVPRWIPRIRPLAVDAGEPGDEAAAAPAVRHALEKETQRTVGTLLAWAMALAIALAAQ